MARSVFVSYSVPDRECAFELVARLEARGISVWIAPRDISPSADWAEEIIEAISGARLMVLVFSAHSNASPQVRREVERAVHRQVTVLPFRVEDVLPSKSLEYFLSAQQWLDAFPPPLEPHYARLCAHVGALLGGARPGPAPAAPLAPISEAQLRQLERALAYHIGPIAPHLVRRAAHRSVQLPELIQALAGEIEAPDARRAFLDSCGGLERHGP